MRVPPPGFTRVRGFLAPRTVQGPSLPVATSSETPAVAQAVATGPRAHRLRGTSPGRDMRPAVENDEPRG